MMQHTTFLQVVLICGTIVLTAVGAPVVATAQSIRSTAFADLRFDEIQEQIVKLNNGANLVESPFWGQKGKHALRLDAAKKQFAELVNLPYLDRADAVSLSFLYLSLHELSDDAFHGVIAKRAVNGERTNYGINYNPKSDLLQVYFNDGGGFRVASYPVKNLIDYRRLVHLTATINVSDAPAPDADTQRDDVRIRLFVNGAQTKPTKVTAGLIDGDDAWLTDVDAAGLLNDAPVTIGSSTSASEYSSGLIDELLLFRRALTQSEALRLFREVAGSNAAMLAQQQAQEKPRPPAPKITKLSLWGLQAGNSTRLTIHGSSFASNPHIVLPLADVKQEVVEGSAADKLVVDLTLPETSAPGYYPLRVQTAEGLSNAVAVAVDRLPEMPAAGSSPESPASLPAAFSGTLTGAQQHRIYFRGVAGQRVVADVDARRLGATLDPVLELKSAVGTPLVIEWGRVHLRGDARIELALPDDGLYFVELHALSYRAAKKNPFRLKIGDLPIIDAYYPPAAVLGTKVDFEPIGTGLPLAQWVTASLTGQKSSLAEHVPLPSSFGPTAASPVVRISESIELFEQEAEGDQFQTVDARFQDQQHLPVVVNGRVSVSGEEDRYLLDVVPGESLRISVRARSFDSPLDGRLVVSKHPEGTSLASSIDLPGTRDPGLVYTVPEGVEKIQVAVTDLHRRGGANFLYRLRIIPAARTDFQIRFTTPQVNIPQNGTATLRLEVDRKGFDGPIDLRVTGDDKLSLSPSQIPAGSGKMTLFATLRRSAGDVVKRLSQLKIVASSVGLETPIERVAVFSARSGEVSLPAHGDVISALIGDPVELSVGVNQTLPALFKGDDAELPVSITPFPGAAERAVRLTLVSTEKRRRVNRNDPKQGNRPKVSGKPVLVSAGSTSAKFRIRVPLDVAEKEISFVVRGEVKSHAYSGITRADVHSEPFRLPIRDALSLNIDQDSTNLVAGTKNKIRGALTWSEGFSKDIEIKLNGLPKGYLAETLTVLAGEKEFELYVTVPDEQQPRTLAQLTLTVSAAGARPLLPKRQLSLKVAPPPKNE
jgi:hypothetical protein